MSPDFNCIATGIGSLPLIDPDEAVALSLKSLPEAPIWPQLPQRSYLEHFCGQYSEGLPGLVVNSSKQSFYFDTSRAIWIRSWNVSTNVTWQRTMTITGSRRITLRGSLPLMPG